MYHASLLEKFDFNDIVLSMKSSTVSTMIKAYELAAERCDYPLHLGVTEAGTERMGIIKSSAGIGALLLHGIGDTIRVSLTADPVKEVYAATLIFFLQFLSLSSTSFAIFTRSILVLPQVGHETNCTPSFSISRALRISASQAVTVAVLYSKKAKFFAKFRKINSLTHFWKK